MTALVTGATGFVGSAVVRALLSRGDDVAVLARPTSPKDNLVGLDVQIRDGDLRDKTSLVNACSGSDVLFHVAADYRLWARDYNELYASNVDGTRNLMEAALEADVSRIVYTSSVATLGGNGDGTPGNESTSVSIVDMVGHYKRSKYLAERVVDELVETRHLPASSSIAATGSTSIPTQKRNAQTAVTTSLPLRPALVPAHTVPADVRLARPLLEEPAQVVLAAAAVLLVPGEAREAADVLDDAARGVGELAAEATVGGLEGHTEEPLARARVAASLHR